jgi:MFS family permease
MASSQSTVQAIPRSAATPVASVIVRRWSIVGLLTIGVIVAYIDRVNLSVAVLDTGFKSTFALNAQARGLVNSAFFWSYAAFQIPAGWLVDRRGSKRPYAIGYPSQVPEDPLASPAGMTHPPAICATCRARSGK